MKSISGKIIYYIAIQVRIPMNYTKQFIYEYINIYLSINYIISLTRNISFKFLDKNEKFYEWN